MKYNFDLEDHSKKRKKFFIKSLITIAEFAIVILAAYAITHYGLETMDIGGESMAPTLKNGDHILLNKIAYKLHSVKRNDIVVVRQSGSEHQFYTALRVIGLPGEKIEIRDGAVYIDGELLKEKYDFPKMENGGLALEEFTLENDEYFMLGDNRNECEDSRNANMGNIVEADIVGKAWLRLNSVAIINQINAFGK